MEQSIQNVTEIRIVGWAAVLVWITIMLIGFVLNRWEITGVEKYVRESTDQQRRENEATKAEIKASQRQMKQFCLSIEQVMDKHIRDYPELKQKPWICDAY